MVLFFSDIHLGRGPASSERAIERELLSCLSAYEERVSALYLLGDVFDHFIEYRHLVPKGFVRLQALLAEWTDAGVPVTYIVGNHDPWHRRYFQEELGVRVVMDSLLETLCGRRVCLAHGDGLDPGERTYNFLKPVLRHSLPVWLYTSVLPADLGVGLALKAKRWLGSEETSARTAGALQKWASARLGQGDADGVVLGHSHQAALLGVAGGFYLNAGYFREERTFGILDGESVQLQRWNGVCSDTIHRIAFSALRGAQAPG